MEPPIKHVNGKLSFYDQNDNIPLTLPCEHLDSQTIADALFIHRETKMEVMATAIRTYANWYVGSVEPLEEKFEQIAFGLWIFLRARSKERYQHNLVGEFFSIGQKICCQMTVQDDTEECLDANFEIKVKQDQKSQFLSIRQIHKFSQEDLVQRNQCRSDCVDRISNILRINKGVGEYCTVESFFNIFFKLEDFLELTNPLSKEGRYLGELCYAITTLWDDIIRHEEFTIDHNVFDVTKLRLKIWLYIFASEYLPGERQQLFQQAQTNSNTLDDLIQKIEKHVLDESELDRQTKTQIGTMIAEYYLSIYDFKKASIIIGKTISIQGEKTIQRTKNFTDFTKNRLFAFFKETNTRFVLKLAKTIINNYFAWTILTLLFVIILMLPAFFNFPILISIFGFGLLYASLIFIPTIVLWLSYRDRTAYYQLFFPRLLGAIIAGLGVMVFEGTTWEIGSLLPLSSLIGFTFLVILASVGYLQADLHKVFIRIRHFDWGNARGSTTQIFCIGLMQALIGACVASSLLSSAMQPQAAIGVQVPVWGDFSIGIYPTIVLLWTGVAVFLGTFLQFIGQGIRVTEPI